MAGFPSVVVVTGAHGALGSVLVGRLLERGVRVAAVDRSASAATPAHAEGRLLSVQADATDASAWAALLAQVKSTLGPPEGAVLVAGAYRGGAALTAAGAAEHFRLLYDANLESARLALAALLGGMHGRGRGSIVLIGSRAAVRPWESAGSAAYAVSKAAVVALAQVAAEEAREHGVRVNAVLPSTLDTRANRASMPDQDPTRWVTPESLCEVIEFLLSDASRDVSGAALPVYGRA